MVDPIDKSRAVEKKIRDEKKDACPKKKVEKKSDGWNEHW